MEGDGNLPRHGSDMEKPAMRSTRHSLVSQFERVGNMFYPVGSVSKEHDGNDIETGGGILEAVLCEPGKGCLADLALFEGSNCQLGQAVGHAAAGLYLYEDQGLSVAGHDVRLATLATEVSLHDPIAGPLEKDRSQLFPLCAHRLVVVRPFHTSP